jgi:hypothetical protein
MNETRQQQWKTLDRFVEIRSSCFTLMGEHLQDDCQQVKDYWSIENTDSVVISTIQGGKVLFPLLNYRLGLGKPTLEFPDGRVNAGQTSKTVAREILEKELGVKEDAIAHLTLFNPSG